MPITHFDANHTIINCTFHGSRHTQNNHWAESAIKRLIYDWNLPQLWFQGSTHQRSYAIDAHVRRKLLCQLHPPTAPIWSWTITKALTSTVQNFSSATPRRATGGISQRHTHTRTRIYSPIIDSRCRLMVTEKGGGGLSHATTTAASIPAPSADVHNSNPN